LYRANRKNNSVSFRLHRVGMGLIEVENDSRNRRAGAVLAGAHPMHSVGMDRNSFNAVVADGLRKVEQNPVRIGGRLKRRLYRTAERNFHAEIGALSYRRHTLHPRRHGAVLRRRAR
jgi:hypothetical protein